MDIAIIGSVALWFWMDPSREPADLDIVATYDDIQAFVGAIKASGEAVLSQYPIDSGKKVFIRTEKRIIEAEVAWPGSSGEALLALIATRCKPRRMGSYNTHINSYGVRLMLPSLDMLYMLKMSHRYLKNSPHFQKTRKDILAMEAVGAAIQPQHEEFFKAREAWTYDYKLPKLNKSKAEFFAGDGIVYEWDHDTIHLAVKFMDKPAYQYFSGGQVWSDMDVFETLPEDVKLYAVLEESLVLAAERSQLAFNPAPDARWSFEYALEKVCTSITSGRFRAYAYNNYDKVVALFNEKGQDYMERIRDGIEKGIVKRTVE